MSRSRPKSARKSRPLAEEATSVSHGALQRSVHHLLRWRDTSVELGESLLLRADQAERLSEFQRWHVNEPALCLTDARSIVCPVMARNARPLRAHNGQPLTSRIILEVASRREVSPSGRGASLRVRWYFVAWNDRGHLAHMSTHRTRKAALALFNRPAEQLALSVRGQLVVRPASHSPAEQGGRHE